MQSSWKTRALTSKLYRWVELLILYLVFPLLVILGRIILDYRWILFGVIFVYVCALVWILRPTVLDFGMADIRLASVIKWTAAYAFTATAILFLLFLSKAIDSRLLLFHLAVLVIYPVFSASAQEFFFRSFFFQRYEGIASKGMLAAINIVVFAVYHRIYGGWAGFFLSFWGGLILTSIYLRSRKYLWVWICHAVMGVLVFLSGLGRFFTDLIK